MADKVSKFWMVWGTKRSALTYKHYSKAAARAEAERLSKAAPGELYVVLAAVDAVISPIMPPQSVKLSKPEPDLDDGIPF